MPGGFRYKPPFPKAPPPAVKPAGKPDEIAPKTPLPGPPLGFVTAPEDLLVDADGRPCRIDKAYSWEAPFAAHGLMHTVIANAARGDPYPIDVLFLYMANMSWNSAMNVSNTIADLTAEHPDGTYRIPHIIYSDAYCSEMVAYADLVLPDTTYLERCDCISLLDRPISEADGPADAIRQPVVAPDRDVRPFQDVLLDLGHRLALPGMTTAEGRPRYPGGYADYMVHHERAPGIGSLAGFRGRDGSEAGKGEPNPEQLQRYIENGCHWYHELPAHMRYFRFANRDYLDWSVQFGFNGRADADRHAALLRAAAEISPRRAGPWRCPAAGRAPRAHRTLFRSPSAAGIRRSRRRRSTPRPIRCMPSPSGRWRCTIPGDRRMPG